MNIIEVLVILIILGIAIRGCASYKLVSANEGTVDLKLNNSYKIERIIAWIILLIPIIIIGIVLLLHYN